MNFASDFVYEYDLSDTESLSDDELERGMELSDSDDSDSDESDSDRVVRGSSGTPKAGTPEAPPPPPAPSAGHGGIMSRVGAALGFGGTAEASKPPPAPPVPRYKSKVKSHDSTDSGKKKRTAHWKFGAKAAAAPSLPERHTVTGGMGYAAMPRAPDQQNWKRVRRADTNVVSIKFDQLIKPSNMHTGDAVYCAGCGGILSVVSKLLTTDGADDRTWRCEFCNHGNPVDLVDEELPKQNDVSYMLEPALTTTTSGPSGLDESLVVFCVDVSGSMCVTTPVPGKVKLRGDHASRLQRMNTLDEDQYMPGQSRDMTFISRLQAVQAAVDHQLAQLKKDFPHRRVALVTFNNEVTVIGDGYGAPVTIAGDKLTDMDVLQTIGSELTLPKAIGETRNWLGEKVFDLLEGGGTALGPGLVVSVALAAQYPGSKVIICTDGLANVGLGSLEGLSTSASHISADQFYTGVGETALQKSISISVISIKGTSCKLAHLGKVADVTGGQVNIVDPQKLTEEFSTILADQVIATNVTATFLIHSGLYFRNEETPDNKVSRVVGNVTADTEITFEYGVRKQKKKQPSPDHADTAASTSAPVPMDTSEAATEETPLTELPFQLQIQYTDMEGAKALRVLTQVKPVTQDRNQAEKVINLDVLGTHTAQQTSAFALDGQFTHSRNLALMQQRLAYRYCHQSKSKDAKKQYKGMFNKVKSVENSVSRMQKAEVSRRGTTYSDDDEDEEDDAPVAPPMPQQQLAPLRLTVPAPLMKQIKKKADRTAQLSDSLATELYNMKSSKPSKSDSK